LDHEDVEGRRLRVVEAPGGLRGSRVIDTKARTGSTMGDTG
jgi:hypothetical protein